MPPSVIALSGASVKELAPGQLRASIKEENREARAHVARCACRVLTCLVMLVSRSVLLIIIEE
jgi:hypothetical protein